MSNLQKTLAVISAILIFLLLYLLFFVKYDRYGQSSINTLNDTKFLSLSNDSYKQLENKKEINLKNDNSYYEIKTKNIWTFVSQSDIWITPIETNIEILNGNYMIYLGKQTIWYI